VLVGGFVIIDFEHHYIPIELAQRSGMKTDSKVPVRHGDASIHAQLFDMRAQLQEMDRVGVDIAVLSCILGWETSSDNCRLINDCTARLQSEFPKRYVGLAHVPPLEGEAALGELERAVGELGLKGATIPSQVKGRSLDAPEFRPFFERAAKLGVPVFVHPALAPKGYDLLNDYMLPVILTREFDLGVAVTRLIAGGVLERFPDLRLVFAHLGGGMAGYKERIARSAYRFKLPKSFEEYFDLLYFDMAGFEGSPIALNCALEGIKPERMVFATDYPQNFNNSDPKMGKGVDGIAEYISTTKKLPLDARVIEGMLGGTAASLLKLN
jgi:predicted TIM-barrel fold metal-dependent hydrolase